MMENPEKLYEEYRKELEFLPLDKFRNFSSYMQRCAIEFAKGKREGQRVVVEVTESTGVCNAGYRKGDRLVFNMIGMYIPEESTPKTACVWLLHELVPVFAANEALMSNGVPVTAPYYDTSFCSDPGPPAGWGHVEVRLRIEKTKK